MTNTEKMHEAFEQWFDAEFMATPEANAKYKTMSVRQIAAATWQAALSAQAAPVVPEGWAEMHKALRAIDGITQAFYEGGYGEEGNRKAYREITHLAQTWLKYSATTPPAIQQAAQPMPCLYQLSMKNGAFTGAWIDVEEGAYHSAGLYPEYERRIVYTTTPVPAAPVVPEGFMDFALEAIGTVALHNDTSAKELAAKLRALTTPSAPTPPDIQPAEQQGKDAKRLNHLIAEMYCLPNHDELFHGERVVLCIAGDVPFDDVRSAIDAAMAAAPAQEANNG